MYSRQVCFAFLLTAGFLAASLIDAQEVRATIGGRVTDPAGGVVPNAAITVVSDDTGVKQQTHTNNDGNWTVQFLLPGHYHFSVAASGFKTEERQRIELQASDNRQFDVKLQLGSSAQTVEVTGEPPLIDTTSATSGTVITEEEINELPSQSHVATLLATLSPGVVAQYQNGNVVHLWSYNGASQFTANGGRNNIFSNDYRLDGMPDTKAGGDISFVPAQDSLAQFRVATNAYDAAIERQAGSTINMQTKSGGNRYHGNLYEYNQNNILNANYFQNNLVGGAVPPVHFNEYGFTIGGPVWIPKLYNGRNKTFFFVSWDDTHNIDPRGGVRSVPTALERQGDFTQSFTTQNGAQFPILVYDPNSVNMTTGNRTLFPGDKIPANRLNPIALNILKYVALPNRPSDPTGNAVNNFVSGATRTDTFPVLSIRGDQNWSDAHRSFVVVRWAHLHESLGNDFNDVATGSQMERVPENLGLDHVWVINASKILDLRFAVNRYIQPQNDDGAGFDLTQLGFSPSFASQLAKPSFPHIVGIAGDFGTGQAGTYQNNTYYTWLASLTHVYRNHTFRYGGEFWILQEADGSLGHQPEFTFNNSNWTRLNNANSGGTGVGSSFGSFLLGLPNAGAVDNNATAFYSQRFTGFYFQDDWRVNSKLTLNLGLRWDYERPVIERYNRMTSNYDPTVMNPISPAAQAAYNQILASSANNNNAGVQILKQLVPAGAFQVPGAQLFNGVAGQQRKVTNGDWTNWGPRVGFAYQLGKNTVFRGGVGRFTQADFITGGQNGFSLTTPLNVTQNNYLTPFDTLSNPFQGGIVPPTGSTLGSLTNLGNGVSWVDQNTQRAYSWEYSFHLQHQIHRWLFEVGYSHNKTYNVNAASGAGASLNQNLPSFALWQQLQTPQFDANGRPEDTLRWNLQVPNPFNKLPGIVGTIGSSSTVTLNQLLNPNPLLGGITEGNVPFGSNQFDAMLVKVEHRFSNGFSVINAFTWSKLFENTSFLGPEIAGRIIEHKLGGEDRPFHLSIAPVWQLPFGRGKKWGSNMPRFADYIVGGWELSGTYTAQSGVPVVFSTASFFSGKDFSLPNDQRTMDRWFDTSQFIAFPSKNTDISNYPAWTGIQNLPGYNYKPTAADLSGGLRNGVYQDFANYVRTYPTRWADVRGPGVNNFDVGIFKNFLFAEKVKFQLRFEAYNALNHPRFDSPNSDPTSANFGRIGPTEENNPRVIQMAAKLSF